MSDNNINPELMRGSLDLLVLSTLREEPKYGYLIQQTLRDRSGHRVNLQAGSLYPILHRLEAGKLVRTKWDESTGRRRKWYELTAAGKKQLTSRATQWKEYVDCLREILSPVLETLPEGTG